VNRRSGGGGDREAWRHIAWRRNQVTGGIWRLARGAGGASAGRADALAVARFCFAHAASCAIKRGCENVLYPLLPLQKPRWMSNAQHREYVVAGSPLLAPPCAYLHSLLHFAIYSPSLPLCCGMNAVVYAHIAHHSSFSGAWRAHNIALIK